MAKFEEKVRDPSRTAWDGSASKKPPCTETGCLRKGRPNIVPASIVARAITKPIHDRHWGSIA
jgi:hypothetical protein